MSPVIQYLYNLALGFDQFMNAILFGDPDESLSGRCGRAMVSGKPKAWVPPIRAYLDFIFLVLFKQENHCIASIEPEESVDKELWKWHR